MSTSANIDRTGNDKTKAKPNATQQCPVVLVGMAFEAENAIESNNGPADASLPPVSTGKKRKSSDSEHTKESSNDAATTRLERKRFQEKRRRKEFREALDTLLAALISHDQDFGKEARIRETRMAGRLSYRSPLSEDNPLFNRVEMVNQANFTIERLTQEGNDLRKTLESLGGESGMTPKKDSSVPAPVFHQGVGPLASHQVPPVRPDMETARKAPEGVRQTEVPSSNLSARAGAPREPIIGLPAPPTLNTSAPPVAALTVLRTDVPTMPVIGVFNGAEATQQPQHMPLARQQELLWIHHQMQMEEQRRLLMGHYPQNSIGNLQSYLASQQVVGMQPHAAGYPLAVNQQAAGQQQQPNAFSSQAYELAMITRMMGRGGAPQPPSLQLDAETQYHRAVSNFQPPVAPQSSEQPPRRGVASFSFHAGPSGDVATGDRVSEEAASDKMGNNESNGTGGQAGRY